MPVVLVTLLHDIEDWPLHTLQSHGLLQSLVKRLEVIPNLEENRLEHFPEEIHDPIQVEFWTQQVEEGILAVSLQELRHFIEQFVEEGEAGASVGEAWHHLADVGLEGHHFIQEFFVGLT